MIAFYKNQIALCAAVASLLLLSACGGGNAGSTPSALRIHNLSQSGDVYVKHGVRFEVGGVAESFGADITSMSWQVEPLGSATGDPVVGDAACTNADRRVRQIPDSEKSVVTVECRTTVAVNDFGATKAEGPFRITSTVRLATGETNSEDFVLNVVR